MKKAFMTLFMLMFTCLMTTACGSTTSSNNNDEGDTDSSDTADSTADTGDSQTDTGDSAGDTDADTGDSQGDTGDSHGDTGDSDADTGDSAAGNGTISKIQKGEIQEGTEVTTECVVTAVEYLTDNDTHANTAIKGLYVSELIKKAAPYTGIYLFIKDTADVNEYKAGDKLEVKGTYKEYYESSQIEVSEIKKLGTADVPAPAEIEDPAKVATPFEEVDSEWTPTANHGEDAEKYESVLIKVSDVEITKSDLDHGAFEVTGNLAVDKTLYYHPLKSEGIEFESITGILIYAHDAFRIAPRAAEDLVQETIESEDIISRIQKGEIKEGTKVATDCVVTGVYYEQNESFENTAIKGIYVSELIEQAAPYTGIYVYIKGKAPVDEYEIGDKLKVTGNYSEYYEVSQIEASSIEKDGTAPVPAPAEIEDPSSVSTPFELKEGGETNEWEPTPSHGDDAEKYESVLIKVSDVAITESNIGHGAFEVTGDLAVDKTLYYYEGKRELGKEFESITGILIYSYDAFRLAPRAAGDFSVAN